MPRLPVLLLAAACAFAWLPRATGKVVASDLEAAFEAYLKASNTGEFDEFGRAVAVDGDTLVIGAPGEFSSATGVNGDQTDNGAPYSGAAYVFVRSGGRWMQQAYLKASNTGNADSFGRAVAISGDTIVIGVPFEDSAATGVDGAQGGNGAENAGAAYVFVRSGTSWSQQAYLKASNTDAGDEFGFAVSVSGDTIVVGAHREDSAATGVNGDQGNTLDGCGAAYVFVRNGTSWSQQAYIKASNTGMNDDFAFAVSVSGDTLVAGAWQEDSPATGVNGAQGDDLGFITSGAAYVFVRNGASWSQQAYLKASNTEAFDVFGLSVSVSGDTLVVGATGEDSNATGVNGGQGDAAFNSGAAYVFVRNGTEWSQQAYLKASNTDADDYFGASVSVSGNTLVVGTADERSKATGVNGNQFDNSLDKAGAAYCFVRDGSTWSQRAYIKASNTGAGDAFAVSVCVSGATLVSGAWHEASNATGVGGNQADNSLPGGSGAAYTYTLAPGAWTDLGSGLSGASGEPLLAGIGPLAAGSGNQLALANGKPSSPVMLVFGLMLLDAPFKGGTLVPTPLLLVPTHTNTFGAASLPFTLPSGVPSGTALYFQCWISDPIAVAGYSASNGLQGISS